jgi:hypothetical protein
MTRPDRLTLTRNCRTAPQLPAKCVVSQQEELLGEFFAGTGIADGTLRADSPRSLRGAGFEGQLMEVRP